MSETNFINDGNKRESPPPHRARRVSVGGHTYELLYCVQRLNRCFGFYTIEKKYAKNNLTVE